MKPLVKPPRFQDLMDRHGNRLAEILGRIRGSPLAHGEYLHWDRIRHLDPPDELSVEEWWLGIKFARFGQSRTTPLKQPGDGPFVYGLPDIVLAKLHAIDQRSAGRIETRGDVTTLEARDRYILNSLAEEAINSSQLEGASTTRQVAKDMLRVGRRPRDRDERMILNNFMAMQSIRRIRHEPMSVERILSLHEELTIGTLDNPDAAGRFQTPDEERIAVVDNASGRVAHNPPSADLLPQRMEALVRFANDEDVTENTFIHPLVKAIVLHFWMAYDHPFEDGNGRIARALFYWAMLRADYWLFEYVSISHAIKQAPAQYARAFLETESDENDLTYFLVNQLEAINRSLNVLDEYLERKAREIREVEQLLHERGDLNYRQLSVLSHAIRHPGHVYTIRSHQNSHGTAYATARSDLLELANRGLLLQRTRGNAYQFSIPSDLTDRMRAA